MIEPIIRAGFTPVFYEISEDLHVNTVDFNRKLTKNVAVALMVNFFGFKGNNAEVANICRQHGILTVEDCAHSFIDSSTMGLNGRDYDASIFSFKKLVPSLVGGGVRINSIQLERKIVTGKLPASVAFRDCKKLLDQCMSNISIRSLARLYSRIDRFQANLRERRSVEVTGSTDNHVVQFESYEYNEDRESRSMPSYASRIIGCANYQDVVRFRRKNFMLLLDAMSEIRSVRPLRTDLPDDVCPWAFPVLIDGRSHVDHAMKAKGVRLFTFGETPHDCWFEDTGVSQVSRSTADELRSSVLCLSIHQGISERELMESASIIDSIMKRAAER